MKQGTNAALVFGAMAALVGSAACRAPAREDSGPRGEFGIFFGGQIQERRDIPFELDRTKQSQGFRVEWTRPLSADAVIEWRIDRPRSPSKGRRERARTPDPQEPAPREPVLERVVVHAGETRFDRPLVFEPGDPLGLWNVRVVAAGSVVVDRAFEVYEPAERKKAAAAADGGR